MSDSAEQLREVVGSFVSAEESLRRLEAKRAALADAAERFRDADDSMRSTTEEAVRSLESTKGLLDEHIVALGAVASHTDEVLNATAELVAVLRSAVEQLQRIDPDRFMSDLAELRRDMSDNGIEVRETRRAATEAQTAVARVGTQVESLAAATAAGRDDAAAASQAMTARLDNVTASLASHRTLLMVLVAVGSLCVVLSLVAAIRG